SQVFLPGIAFGNCLDFREFDFWDWASFRRLPKLTHAGPFRRCYEKTWDSVPPAGLSDQQEIPSGGDGLRGSSVRLRQRRPPRYLFRQRCAARRSDTKSHDSEEGQPEVLESALSPEIGWNLRRCHGARRPNGIWLLDRRCGR